MRYLVVGGVAANLRDKRMLASQLRPSQGHVPSLDVLVKPAVPFEPAYERRVMFKVEDFEIAVVSSQDLIALKSGIGRQIDRSDIEALRRMARQARRTYYRDGKPVETVEPARSGPD